VHTEDGVFARLEVEELDDFVNLGLFLGVAVWLLRPRGRDLVRKLERLADSQGRQVRVGLLHVLHKLVHHQSARFALLGREAVVPWDTSKKDGSGE
jgi:hypothetical protein